MGNILLITTFERHISFSLGMFSKSINFKNPFESGALKCIMPGVCDILKVLENEYANLKK